jgi:hypothetical protein
MTGVRPFAKGWNRVRKRRLDDVRYWAGASSAQLAQG